MATTKQRARPLRRTARRLPATHTRLAALLRREGLTLGDVRRILLPPDPWDAAKGIWADRRARAERGQRKLRKEWMRRA